MTDDIVTRLREWHTAWNWYLPDEAADEIERLRASIQDTIDDATRELTEERDAWRSLATLYLRWCDCRRKNSVCMVCVEYKTVTKKYRK